MLIFPALSTGALCQYPTVKRHRVRTVTNRAPDGSVIALADPGGEAREWQLIYAGLSDTELAALLQFFKDAEGSLKGFTFLDPTGNLMAWSEDLDNPAWTRAPFVTATKGTLETSAGNQVWHIANIGAAPQRITQRINAPGGYIYCFSLYAQSTAPDVVTVLHGESRFTQTVGVNWRRIACTATGDAAAASTTFGLELAPGAALSVYGLQVESQGRPSTYRASTTGGVYQDARLRDDTFSVTTTGPNCHSATVNVIHANHL